ncbi:MAG: alpha/beta hydrolase, partial [Clostridia bacterium]|nr:alpha/beta hydrolase [Clostridia bacterium]
FYADRSHDLDPYGRIDMKSHKPYKDEIRSLIDNLVSLPCERVSINARDGVRLSARYYHTGAGAPIVILAHGYRGNSLRDFAGGADMFLKMGYNLLLIDHRAHGDSGGKVISFGIRERFDVCDWAAYATDRFGEDSEILLAGISMGGACVLMAAGEDLPDTVKGVLADCPYSSPLGIIARVGTKKGVPDTLVRIFAITGARFFAKFALNEASALTAVEKTELPILIIHGDADGFVPLSMSEELKKKNPSIILKTVSGADHAVAYLADTEGYISEVKRFTEQILGGQNGNQ